MLPVPNIAAQIQIFQVKCTITSPIIRGPKPRETAIAVLSLELGEEEITLYTRMDMR